MISPEDDKAKGDPVAARAAKDTSQKAPGKAKADDKDGKKGDPEWTTGLKRLYDNVLDEPLPDAFADLLSKLDENGAK
ncbi:MAG: NepR family anti-sigma factor [Alteraurantiacibacter sp. bin_em_oilr2.035]|uniref:NepR family anti-sigma factor n=1 Tax=Aurantiacibacter atlanticus TaxID=1648404 RepID=UPI0009ED8F3C|nr:NepR family anti-sigma factor [Aurantiacibacter atlanticus]MDF1833940.1 NepR family anti-sigma factor [Alteraurantiacibacter sp. bin_em_oilr2.035]